MFSFYFRIQEQLLFQRLMECHSLPKEIMNPPIALNERYAELKIYSTSTHCMTLTMRNSDYKTNLVLCQVVVVIFLPHQLCSAAVSFVTNPLLETF